MHQHGSFKTKNWAERVEKDLLTEFRSSQTTGIHKSEVDHRIKEFGPNILRSHKAKSIWFLIWQQLRSVIVLLLFIAATVSFFLNELVEGVAILMVLVINTFIGFAMEFRAARSMEALRKLGRTTTTVVRDGETLHIDAENLVPGDIVLVEGGDIITADIRILEASRLEADESTLTGESLPVEKRVETISHQVPLAERTNMLFKGSAITNGSGRGLVVATGMETELGRIAELTIEAKDEVTPLEKRLDKLGQRLVWLSLVMVVIIGVSGVLAGKELVLMFETAVALAVATIPEGLPIVATIALAKGMWRMAKHNALINRLSAVETLGATTVIFSDKTGTLTQNRMTVGIFSTSEGFWEPHQSLDTTKNEFFKKNGERTNLDQIPSLSYAIKIGVLCNNASLGEEEEKGDIGDPMEIALLKAGKIVGFERTKLCIENPEIKEEAFDPSSRMMATLHQNDGKIFVAVKGAPESIISSSSFKHFGDEVKEVNEESRGKWLEENKKLAEKGFRVLGIAYKWIHDESEFSYSNLVFVGLVGLSDPPREGVEEAIKNCREAGIKVVMVTGDQAATAKSIGAQIGILPEDIYSRVSPEEKLNLVQKYQKEGAVVAMTGDGVNDAPALKKADIGVAMGKRGTQVAREAADLVLKDDNFSSIVLAVFQGRVVFSNIRRFVVYLLSCNLSEVFIVSAATVVNAPLPILPLQILFLNLVTDVFPALALGMGEGDPSYLKNPPRKPKEPIITPKLWWTIGGYGALVTISVLIAFFGAFEWLGVNKSKAVTISFLTLAFAQVFHVFNMRDKKSGIIANDITKNPHVWGAVILCCLLLFFSTYFEVFRKVLKLSVLDLNEWIWVGIWSLIPLVVGQFIKIFGDLYHKWRM